MNLNEACEKAAKFWFGWEVRKEGRCKPQWYTGPESWNTASSIARGNSSVLYPEEIVRLASPKGMDLLLNAAEEKGFDWMLVKGNFPDAPSAAYLRKELKDGWPWVGFHENRYEAIVYAFAKAADALEGK